MKMIVISQENFDLAFLACVDKLRLDTFESKQYANLHSQSFINLHRKFHYEITGLKNQLEKG